MHIPGLIELTDREEIPKCMILLTGNSNVGKSSYSREYLLEQINDGLDCIYISCTETEELFQNWMMSRGVSRVQINSNLHFINPYVRKKAGDNGSQLPGIISEIKDISGNSSSTSSGIQSIEVEKKQNRAGNALDTK